MASVAIMSSRTITPEDQTAAKTFARALLASGRTHEAVAADVGVSAGMVYQWAKPLRVISARRAPAVAAAVGIDDPGRISVAYRQLVPSPERNRREEPAPAPPAAPVDMDLMRSAILVTERAFQAQHVTMTPEAHADIIMAVYDLLKEGQEDAGIERIVAQMLHAIGGSTVTT